MTCACAAGIDGDGAVGVRFYLGTHLPGWLAHAPFALFISHRRLRARRRLPVARHPWALDSGAFSELQQYGEWRTTAGEYVRAVGRYAQEIGNLAWAAPMDWMCEPVVIAGGRVGRLRFAGTHLPVSEHQHRTIANFLRLRDLGPHLPWIPVLQGWTLGDYLRCVDLYAAAGVDLTAEPVVGLGSVCRRQATAEIDFITDELAGLGLRLHGFGVKALGLRQYADRLVSADSLAWSYAGRREQGCTPSHKTEANCWRYAVAWRERTLAALQGPRQLTLNAAMRTAA